MVEWLNGRRCPNGCLCKYVAISSAMHPQHSEYFVMAVAASGSQNFPVPGCFQMLLPHLVPRQAEHKSKVKFFTRTKLSVKNFTFTLIKK